MATVKINGHEVHAASQREGGQYFVSDASQSNYIIVQLNEKLNGAIQQQLTQSHVQVGSRIALDTYLCRYVPADLDTIRRLPFIHYANVYHQDFVIHNDLINATGSQPVQPPIPPAASTSEPRDIQGQSNLLKETPKTLVEEKTYAVAVTLHPHSMLDSQDLKQHMTELLQMHPDSLTADAGAVKGHLRAQDMAPLARHDDVRGIEELAPLAFCNYKGRVALKVQNPRDAKKNYGCKPATYEGSGEIVSMADSGFDQGLMVDTGTVHIHPAFRGRIAALQCFDRVPPGPPVPNTVYDDHGHGTHVAGSIVGSAICNDFGFNITGTAPQARLWVWAMNPLIQVTLVNYQNLIDTPYADAAFAATPVRVFSYSWGIYDVQVNGKWVQALYDAQTRIVDQVTFARPDMLAVWAAGNSGQAGKPMVGSVSVAKNVLTVGATWSGAEADTDEFTYDNTEPPSNPDEVCAFSSYGPSAGNDRESRFIKPDVVAPGCPVLSARTQHKRPPDWNDPFDPSVPAGQVNRCGVINDTNWLWSRGTSMAAPQVAGCVAVLRRIIVVHKGFSPKGALLKALIVNGATDLSITDAEQLKSWGHKAGFGLVNLDMSILNVTDTTRGQFFNLEGKRGILVNVDRNLNITVPAAIKRSNFVDLRITMAFPEGSDALIRNQLQLRVENQSTSEVRYANSGTAQPNPRIRNNVQRLIWKSVTPGLYKIVITNEASLDLNAQNRANCYLALYYEEVAGG